MIRRAFKIAVMASAMSGFSGTAQAEDAAAEAESTRRETIIVTGRRDDRDTGATKSGENLINEAQSVSLIDAKTIEDQFALTQDDVLRNIPTIGRTSNQGNVGGSQNTTLRGFSTRTVYKDGARFTTIGEVYLDNIASVEVLKGPAGMLFGSTPPGGVITYSRKKPQPEFGASVNISGGSDKFLKFSADVTGPLAPEGALSFRLIAAVQDDGRFVDFADAKSYFFSPSLRFQRNGLTLDLVYEFGWLEETFLYGLPFDLVVPNRTLRRDLFLGDPGQFKRSEDEAIAFSAAWDVSDRTRLRLLLNQTRFTHTSLSIRPGAYNIANRTYTPSGSLRPPTPTVDRSAEFNLTTEFALGGMRNVVLAGTDYRRSRNDFPSCNGNRSGLFTASVDAPNYNAVDPLSFSCSTPGFVFFDPGPTIVKEAGAFIQNDLWISEQFKFLAGIRYGNIKFDNLNLVSSVRSEQSNSAVTLRGGALYKPVDSLSIYASYAESFQQLIGRARDNRVFQPTTGSQYEAGVKWSFFDSKASMTASVFEITQQNLTLPDPIDPNFSIQEGEVRSRGGEVEITGQFGPRLTLVGGYGYIDNAVVGGANNGRRLANVYKHKVSLFANYALVDSDALTWTFGGGAFYHGRAFLNAQNNRAIPSATIFDLATALTFPTGRGDLELQLNIKNVTNKFDFTGFGNGAAANIFPEPGRQFFLSVGHKF
jgi:iron complex outermembrane receptor protein